MFINGWKITHDGFTWWAHKDGEESFAGISYRECAQWAHFNKDVRQCQRNSDGPSALRAAFS